MDPDELVERVRRWAGLPRKRDARRAIAATTRALRESLFGEEAKALEQDLPPRLVQIFRDGSHVADRTLTQFYERVAQLEHVAPSFALEHAQGVCEALASLLPNESVERLTRQLPDLACSSSCAIDKDIRPRIRRSLRRWLREGRAVNIL